MNETTFMDLLNWDDHLDEDLDGNFEVISLLEASPSLGKVDAKQVHHNKILLNIVDVIVRIWNMLQTYK